MTNAFLTLSLLASAVAQYGGGGGDTNYGGSGPPSGSISLTTPAFKPYTSGGDGWQISGTFTTSGYDPKTGSLVMQKWAPPTVPNTLGKWEAMTTLNAASFAGPERTNSFNTWVLGHPSPAITARVALLDSNGGIVATTTTFTLD